MGGRPLRVATFNVNNVNRRLPVLLAWNRTPQRHEAVAPRFMRTLFAVPTAIALYAFGMSRRLAGIIGLLMVPTLAYTFEAPEMKLIGAVLLLTFTVVKIFRFEGLSPARPGR